MQIRFHNSVVKAVQDNQYDVNDDELGRLVETKFKAGAVDERVGDSYFRILVRRSQRVAEGNDMERVNAAHKPMYKIVRERAVTPDVAPKKSDSSLRKAEKHRVRNSRTQFARTAKSALVQWLSASESNTLDSLDVESVTKAGLERDTRDLRSKAAEDAGENTPEGRVHKRLAALITALQGIEDAHKRMDMTEATLKAIAEALTYSA